MRVSRVNGPHFLTEFLFHFNECIVDYNDDFVSLGLWEVFWRLDRGEEVFLNVGFSGTRFIHSERRRFDSSLVRVIKN